MNIVRRLTPSHVWQEEDQPLVVESGLLVARALHAKGCAAAFEAWVAFVGVRVEVERFLERASERVIAAVRLQILCATKIAGSGW